jgi:predicted phosphodiesterase
MRLLVLSDLHLEQWRQYAPRINPSISQPDAIILAGDIHNGGRAVPWAQETFRGLPVLYVHGNHEAYGSDIESACKETFAACASADNVHFLKCGEHRIGDVRFLGTTLWADFDLFDVDNRSLSMTASEDVLADYRCIHFSSTDSRLLRATDTARLHVEQRAWLEEKLDEPFNGKTVVITHMAPSMKSVAARYAQDLVSSAFASNLEDLVMKADLWVHGHTHDSFDYAIGKCRVVCNPCGYLLRSGVGENPLFDPNFIAEI